MTFAHFVVLTARWLIVLVGVIEFAAGLTFLLAYWLLGDPRYGSLALTWLAYGVAVVGLYLLAGQGG